jgi:CMP-N,N'-diacetyllegionaminic acid synthase
MRNVILIPARAGSKGIKNKNFLKVKGVPLTLRSINHARYIVSNQSLICISTDSSKLMELCVKVLNLKVDKKYIGQEFVFINSKIILHRRPAELSHDESLISDLLFYLRQKLNAAGIETANWLILQPTSPFRSKNELIQIKKILRAKMEDLNFSLVSVTKVSDMHPARMYRNGSKGTLKPESSYQKFYYKRRQDLPEVFIRDGGFYIIGNNLVENKLQYSRNPMPFYRDEPWSLNIDKNQELFLAKSLENSRIKEDPNESGNR